MDDRIEDVTHVIELDSSLIVATPNSSAQIVPGVMQFNHGSPEKTILTSAGTVYWYNQARIDVEDDRASVNEMV